MWCIPEASAEYVACMEDVLDLYEEPYQPEQPVVCYDESPKQLIQETRTPLPAKPGQPERYDYEYERNGVANLLMFFEPLVCQREVLVTERHTQQDFAQAMKWLVDDRYPQAEKIRVVLDNLGTHKKAALYEAFPAAEANRIARKLEFHYTPKHGSWLNMAEIELSVYFRRLGERVPNKETLKTFVGAIDEERNRKQTTVHWQFTTQDARIKLHSLYPSFLE